ncbi:MAG: trigger factor [Desulfosalsimonadaceae bacterium]
MQVTVEDVSAVKKRIHVEIPREEVSKELDSAYKDLKKKAKIKGYRPGKVPRPVLERLFKKDVHSDVIQNLVQESFPKALQETDLQVIDTSDIDTPELDPDSDFKYNATVELKPQLPDVDFKGLEIKKTEYTVSEGEIDAQVEMLRKHLAEYHTIAEDRPAADGDYITIDYEGYVDGQPYPPTAFTENHAIKIGEKAFTEDFDKALAGMKAGESREITVTFPEDYNDADLAGREITFTVKLKEIKEEILPPVDDEFAKKFGKFETLSDLRAEIESNLRQGYEKRTNQEMQEQIFNKLLENEFEVPDVMVRHELDEIAKDTEQRFAQNGLSMEQVGLTREIMDQQYRPVAEQQARRHLLLNKIIEQENLEVAEEELDAEYEKLSEMIGQPLDFIKKFYKENPGKQDGFKIALLEKKAVDLIINHATVETVQPEEKATEEASGDAPETSG